MTSDWWKNLSDIIKKYKKAGGEPGRSTDDATRTGLLTPSVYAMICDGQKQEAELLLLFTTLVMSPAFEGEDPAAFFSHVDAIERRLAPPAAAQKVIAEAIEPLSPALRETSYAFAMRMIYADKTLHMAELELAEHLHEWMDVKPQLAKQIRDTMAIIARPPSA